MQMFVSPSSATQSSARSFFGSGRSQPSTRPQMPTQPYPMPASRSRPLTWPHQIHRSVTNAALPPRPQSVPTLPPCLPHPFRLGQRPPPRSSRRPFRLTRSLLGGRPSTTGRNVRCVLSVRNKCKGVQTQRMERKDRSQRHHLIRLHSRRTYSHIPSLIYLVLHCLCYILLQLWSQLSRSLRSAKHPCRGLSSTSVKDQHSGY
jgi:hypothetical protein